MLDDFCQRFAVPNPRVRGFDFPTTRGTETVENNVDLQMVIPVVIVDDKRCVNTTVKVDGELQCSHPLIAYGCYLTSESPH